MPVVRRLPRAFGDRSSPFLGTLILFAGLIATLVAIWGAGSIKRGEIDLGQYMVRHLRYTYAEIVALDGLLGGGDLRRYEGLGGGRHLDSGLPGR